MGEYDGNTHDDSDLTKSVFHLGNSDNKIRPIFIKSEKRPGININWYMPKKIYPLLFGINIGNEATLNLKIILVGDCVSNGERFCCDIQFIMKKIFLAVKFININNILYL